jgi:ABC-2 type transport system ATP-binding protein
MNALDFENIRRAYRKGINVLDGVTFSVERGEVVGLLGKNGAGKTTLIRIAMGMIAPQAGSVRVLGMDPRAQPVAMKRRIGYVSEDQILPPFMSVRDVMSLHRQLYPTWDDGMARRLAERFDLPPDARIRTLSKGQARRVALLCAVSHRPEVLLLDEPASGLDPAARREFLETSIRLLNEAGSSILFSSHYMTDIERLAGRIVMIHGGKVIVNSPLDDLRERFALAVVRDTSRAAREQLLALDSCLSVREQGEGLHAIVGLEPADARSLIERHLGVTGVRCHAIPLEDLFVELAGGPS